MHTSELCRATETVDILARAAGWHDGKSVRASALNERHYGELEGWRRSDARRALGEKAYNAMHRGWTDSPPCGLAVNADAIRARGRYPGKRNSEWPGESLADVSVRVIGYWLTAIRPQLLRGQHVLVVGHSNSLRVLIKLLRDVPECELASIAVEVCRPMLFTGECWPAPTSA